MVKKKIKNRMTGEGFRVSALMYLRLAEDVSHDIEVASSMGDMDFVKYGFKILMEASDGALVLMDDFWGKPAFKLGVHEESGRNLEEGTPPEVLDNIRVSVSVYLGFILALEKEIDGLDEIEARKKDAQRNLYVGQMSVRVKIGKKIIMGLDPSFWTEALEKEFRYQLDYGVR